MKGQIEESVADGYSLYHVLANLFDSGRETAITALRLGALDLGAQDRVLLSLVIIAVGGYLFMRPLPSLNANDVYKNTHPPQVVRMDVIMQESRHWCGHNRPELQEWMDTTRFQELMSAVTEATLGSNTTEVAGGQAAFLNSPEGQAYYRALVNDINAYKASL